MFKFLLKKFVVIMNKKRSDLIEIKRTSEFTCRSASPLFQLVISLPFIYRNKAILAVEGSTPPLWGSINVTTCTQEPAVNGPGQFYFLFALALWVVVTKLGVTTPSAPQKQSNRARDHITNFPWKPRWRLKQKMLKKSFFI